MDETPPLPPDDLPPWDDMELGEHKRTAENDPFKPPAEPTIVHCLHCDREYSSSLIEWREWPDEHGRMEGFWCCPTPGCGGKGFGCDCLPIDPLYQYKDDAGNVVGGWFNDDGTPMPKPPFGPDDDDVPPGSFDFSLTNGPPGPGSDN